MFSATLVPLLFSISGGQVTDHQRQAGDSLALHYEASAEAGESSAPADASEGDDAEAAGPGLGDDLLDEAYADEPEPQSAADTSAQDDKDAEMAAARERKGDRYNQWNLHVAPTFTYLRGFQGAWKAVGGGARLGAWKLGWRQNFMIGGGPVVVFNYVKDKANDDTIMGATLNGDLLVGGGKANKFAVYGHLTLGLGVVSFRDGATNTSGILPWGQGRIGAGGHYYVNDKISVGLLADFGGGFTHVAVDAMLTLGVHFGKS